MTTLSDNQERAFELFKQNKNLFITGPGGTGKTHIIKLIYDYANNNKRNIQVCALTGCAAILLNCKATTIHSWSGIGLANGFNNNIIKKVVNNKYIKKRWNNIDILVIDEVSMMSKKVFNILNEIAKQIRKNDKPFGGIQIILSGDFYQLPPVNTKSNDKDNDIDIEKTQFCFESEYWKQVIDNTIELTYNFRQNDNALVKILNQIRVGKLTKSSYKKLLECVDKKDINLDIKATILFPVKKNVNIINNQQFNKLTTKINTFNIKVEFEEDKLDSSITNNEKTFEANYLMNNIMAEKELHLRVGTQVMCIANIDNLNDDINNPIVNGSQGIIIDFKNNLPLVKFNNGSERLINYHTWRSEKIDALSVSQIPLIYSWAITIHKAQGVSLDKAFIDIGKNIFECGQTYVALSRIKSFDGLYLKNIDLNKIKINKKVYNFYNNL
jgi:ATP-dependent DNA helicase PIF1